MNEEIQAEINNNSKNIWILVLSVVLTALVVGIGMYLLQNIGRKNTEKALQTQVEDLQAQIEELKKIPEKTTDNLEVLEDEEKLKTLNVTKKVDLEIKQLAINTENWKTYTNDGYGFSFSYPDSFAIVKDAVKVIYSGNSNAKNWYQVTLIDLSNSENNYFNVDINPDGYGPFFYDKIYDLSMSSAGKVVVNSVDEIPANAQNTDGKIQIGSNIVKDFNNQDYAFRFGYNENGKDMEAIFKGILNSLLFTK